MKNLRYWFENLSPESLKELSNYYSDDAFFKDPFNEINGLNKIEKIFSHMFENLENPHFIFQDEVTQNSSTFLTWDFVFTIGKTEWKIHGGSHLRFNQQGKVNYHRDYWDVGEELIAKLPVMGGAYRFFTRKLKV